jgi:hypothetical protein
MLASPLLTDRRQVLTSMIDFSLDIPMMPLIFGPR